MDAERRSDYRESARNAFEFRLRHGLPREQASPLLGVSLRDLEALEDFRFARIPPRAIHVLRRSIPAADRDMECSPMTAGRAAAIAERSVDQARQATVEGYLREMADRRVTRSMLLRKFRTIFRADLDCILQNLIGEGLIEACPPSPEDLSNGGRPPFSVRWRQP